MNSLNYMVQFPHSLSSEKVCEEHSSNVEKGLDDSEINQRLHTFGPNIIQEKDAESPIVIFLSQFKGPFVILLFIAAGLSFWFKEWLDGIAILVVIIINAIIGFLMEYKAERSMEALKRLTKMNAKVLRGGKVQEISSDQLVPGDIMLAEAGDIVLADARIIQYAQLQVDESALTGESVAIDKEEKLLPENTPLAERVNMIYKGTFITKGNVKAVVTATAMQTELGSIATMVQSADQTATPLEQKIAQFSKKILWLTVALIVIIFIAGVLDGDNVVSMLQTSIALAVAAIPEGLPIVTTLALAQGMLRMARQNVIIKKLTAVETLGGTNIICTDKTGTLTQNRIEVNTIAFPGASTEIQQEPILKKTEFVSGNKEITTFQNYNLIKRIAALCNTAEIFVEGNTFREMGDPLETGLLKFVYSSGDDIAQLRKTFPKLGEEPFSSDTKIMSTLHRHEGKNFIASKGAVEELLLHCTHLLENGQIRLLDDPSKSYWIKEAEKYAQAGLRIIAVAYRETESAPLLLSSDLVFVGLLGLLDPPREDVYGAIQECQSAGIDIIMITGDHPATARNIGRKLGLIHEETVIHGKEMQDYEQLSNTAKQRWREARIFARVTPKQKLDLVKVLQENNSVVGMTGDGVNDAPALKKADIGIAMGQRGTQVAQEVADIVLKNDSFSSIVLAIRQGRIIFENIRKFIIYLLSCNLSELFIISFSSVMNLHYALFPLQILYINLVTDVLPALALGVTEGSSQIMKQPPRNSKEQLIDRRRWISIVVYSLIMAACSLAAVVVTHFVLHNGERWNPELCNNILFITLILSQLWHTFNMTTDNDISFFKTDIFKNRYVWYATLICLILTFGVYLIPSVARVLSLYHPSFADLEIMLGFSILSLLLIRLLKRLKIIF